MEPRKTKNQDRRREELRRRKIMLAQKLLGMTLIILCVGILALASTGEFPIDSDASAILILLPMGTYMIATRNEIITIK